MEPMWNVTVFTDQAGRLVSRQFHHMVRTQFDSGAAINIMYNRRFERLDMPFQVASDVVIDPGKYRFYDLRLSYNSDPSRSFTYSVNYGPQTFFDGDRTDMSLRAGVRVTDKLATSARFSRSDIDLAAGSFTANIGSFQIDYAFSPAVSLRTLTQYNSSADQWSTSARFRYIYRPGSDIYIVYDDVRRDTDIPVSPFLEEFRDRQLLIKVTYLLSM